MALRKTSPLFIAVILLIGILVGLEVLFHPRLEVHREIKLVGPPIDKAVTLMDQGRPLEEIQKAVAESGKGVDDIRGFSGAMLYCAAEKKRMDVAEWLLAQGANPNGIGVPLYAAILEHNLPMMKLLLKSGADPNLCGAGNVSPLDAAILDKDVPIVKLLVEVGADPDLCSPGHVSPRRLAEVEGNREIINALPPRKKDGHEGGTRSPGYNRSNTTRAARHYRHASP